MAGSNELCAMDVITEICKKEHIRGNASILKQLLEEFCNTPVVSMVQNSDVQSIGGGEFDISVIDDPRDGYIAITEDLTFYEFDGTAWTLKFAGLGGFIASASDNGDDTYTFTSFDGSTNFTIAIPILSVEAGPGIDVDVSDPKRPSVGLNQASQDSLQKADNAVQPGDLPPPQDLQSVTDVGNTTTNPVKFRNDGASVTGYNTYELAHKGVDGTGAIVIRFPNAPTSTVKFEISLSSYYISPTPSRNLTYHVWGRTSSGSGWDGPRRTAGVVGSAYRPNTNFDDPVPSLRFATDGNGDPAIIIGDTSSSFRFTHISITRLESVMNSEITDVTIELATSEAEFTSVVEAKLNENIPISEQIPFADEVTLTSTSGELSLKNISGSSSKLGTVYVYDDITISSIPSAWLYSVVEIKGVVEFVGSTNTTLSSTTVLKFDGGKFLFNGYTGRLNISNTKLIAPPYQIFEGEFSHNNNFLSDIAYPEWFGAKGDGVSKDGYAFHKTNSAVKSNAILLQDDKTYILERYVAINGKLIGGRNSVIKRYDKFVDIPITGAINIEAGDTHTITVDDSNPTYQDLEIGMGVAIVNDPGQSRDTYPGFFIVSDIQGDQVTIIGNPLGQSRPANTMSLISGYPLIRIGSTAVLSEITNVVLDGGFDDSGLVFPLDRCYWEKHPTVTIHGISEGVSISNCMFINSLADAITGTGYNTNISNCIFKHLTGSAVHLSGSYRTKIIGNYIFDTNLNILTGHNEAAIILSRSVYETSIIDNIIDNCLRGIGDIDGSDNCKVYIRGNTIKNFRLHGISGYAGVTKELITRDFIITNNRISATQDFTYTEEANKEYTPLEPRTEATGNGIQLTSAPTGTWENLVISNNILEDCGIEVNRANWVAINDNVINIQHTFIASVPSDIIKVSDSKGIMNANVIKSNTPSKTNCFVLTNSKVSTKNNAYDLTNCTLSDAPYALLIDNVDISQ